MCLPSESANTVAAEARYPDLDFAHQDALDLVAALKHSQNADYAKVFVKALVNDDATKAAIFDELIAISGRNEPR